MMLLLKNLQFELQKMGLCCTFDLGVNGAQMEILETSKIKKGFSVQICPQGSKWIFFGVTSLGGEGQGV